MSNIVARTQGRDPSLDDVLEFATLSSFPSLGESSKIYIAADTSLPYRWDGGTYVAIASSIALGETAFTAYRGDRGKIAYDHSQVTGNPHNTDTSDIADTIDKRYVTDAEKGKLASISGTNTGDQDISGLVPNSRQINGHPLTGDVTITKSDIGLGNVDNTSDASKPISAATQIALDNKADLVGGVVPSAQLPPDVHDVLEFATLPSFPLTGQTGKIYIALDTNLAYRWTGSIYQVISSSLALGETSATAYRGDRGKIAYDHSQTSGNPHGTTKLDVGLGNVPNVDATNPTNIVQDSTHRFVTDIEKTTWNGKQDALGFTPENQANKGVANGYASLDGTGRVPSSELPSYVDDVLEYATFSALPVVGETGKIYITVDDNKTYRWSGSLYVELSSSLALGETSSTAYRGDRGKIAYDHSQTTGNPHGTTKTDLGLDNVDNTADVDKPVSIPQQAVFDLITHKKSFLYAVCGNGKIDGYVKNTDGSLTVIPGSPFTCGVPSDLPQFFTRSPDGKYLYVGGTGTNKLFGFSINQATGALTLLTGFPIVVGSGPQQPSFDLTGRFLYVPNSGSDTVSGFRYNSQTGELVPLLGSPYSVGVGSGPGIIVAEPLNRFIYVVGFSGQIFGYVIDDLTGDLTVLAGFPVSAGSGSDGLDIVFDPAGRFLYTADYFANTITAFQVDPTLGTLSLIGSYSTSPGSGPGWLVIHPSGYYLYVTCYNNDKISGWMIDQKTGTLTQISGSPFAMPVPGFPSGHNPTTIDIDQTGKFAYVASSTPNKILTYSIDETTGQITAQPTYYPIDPGANQLSVFDAYPNTDPDVLKHLSLTQLNELLQIVEFQKNKNQVNGYAGLDASGKVPLGELPTRKITVAFNAGTALLTVGATGEGREILPGTITKWTLIGDVVGSCSIDIKKATIATYPTMTSIVAGTPPTLSSGISAESSTLTGWTTAISTGDILRFVLTSTSLLHRVLLILEVTA